MHRRLRYGVAVSLDGFIAAATFAVPLVVLLLPRTRALFSPDAPGRQADIVR